MKNAHIQKLYRLHIYTTNKSAIFDLTDFSGAESIRMPKVLDLGRIQTCVVAIHAFASPVLYLLNYEVIPDGV